MTISFAKVAAERLAAVMESVAEAAIPNLVIPDAADQTEARKIMLSVKGSPKGPISVSRPFSMAKTFVGRVHDKEEAVALRVGTIEMRDVMLEAEPRLFYITDHYRTLADAAGAAKGPGPQNIQRPAGRPPAAYCGKSPPKNGRCKAQIRSKRRPRR